MHFQKNKINQSAKPRAFYYVVAVYCIFAGFRLLFNEVWPAFEKQTFGYQSFLSAYYKIIAWYGLLVTLLLISGGILAFKKPRLSWFLLTSASFALYFQIFLGTSNVLFPLLNATALMPNALPLFIFSSAFFDFVLVCHFFPISIYFLFATTGKQISLAPKILMIAGILIFVLALTFINPMAPWNSSF
jgi:hypothetical protein